MARKAATPATSGAAAAAVDAAAALTKADGDFFWSRAPEPHAARRRAIIAAHPAVTKLCGVEPLTKYVVVLLVALHVGVAAVVARYKTPYFELSSPLFWLVAYFIGGSLSSSLLLAVHETTHNLASRSRVVNLVLAFFANAPQLVPFAGTFPIYHLEHHKQQGKDMVDVDIPTAAEARVLNSVLGRAFYCTWQMLFYALRPLIIRPKAPTPLVILNWFTQAISIFLIHRFLGLHAIIYLGACLLIGGSIHPLSAHYIAEHYVFDPPYETYSYVGALNILTFNVGYHNEHHDFPAIPWTRLPVLRRMAPEFYENEPTRSWLSTHYDFITRGDMSLFSRVKRH